MHGNPRHVPQLIATCAKSVFLNSNIDNHYQMQEVHADRLSGNIILWLLYTDIDWKVHRLIVEQLPTKWPSELLIVETRIALEWSLDTKTGLS